MTCVRIDLRLGAAALAPLLWVLLPALPVQAAGWLTAQSDHFAIVSDAPPTRVREYLGQLEAFREAALMVLGADGAGTGSQSRFDIVLLKREEGLVRVRPEFRTGIAGAYFQCAEGSIAYASLQPDTRGRSDFGLTVLFHEYAHRLTFQYARIGYPQWYVEGFAEYMGAAQVRDGKVSIGDPPAGGRVQALTRAWIPYEEVLKPRLPKLPDTPGDLDAYVTFYAQSWLLTHYMLSDSERARKVNTYFERVGAGEDPISAFEPATGIAPAALRSLLDRYLGDLPVIRIPVREVPAASLKIEALPEQDSDVVLAASVLRTCPSKAQGEAILAKLRALKKERTGGAVTLPLALARAELLFGDVQAALDALHPLVVADGAGFEARHLFARALTKSAEGLEGEARREKLDQARAEFFKAYRMKKHDAPNLYHLARALARNGVEANALNAARGAHALDPAVPEYAVYEARVDLDVGDRERAAQALTAQASDPHNPKSAARARLAIEAIRAGKTSTEVLLILEAERQKDSTR